MNSLEVICKGIFRCSQSATSSEFLLINILSSHSFNRSRSNHCIALLFGVFVVFLSIDPSRQPWNWSITDLINIEWQEDDRRQDTMRRLGKVCSDRGEGDNEKIIVEKERGNKPS